MSEIRVVSENEFAQIQIADENIGLADVTRNIELPLEVNSITVPIIIKSQDGEVTKTYNIIFARISNNTDITSVKINDIQVLPNDAGNYEITVKASQESAKIEVVLDDELAKITLGGNVERGSITETTFLPQTGDTTKTITITAQDGTVVTHKIIIHKQVNDLTLASVKVGDKVATQIDDTTYEIYIPKNITIADIEAVANKSSEYVSIEDNTDTVLSNTYADYDLTDKEVKIVVKAMFNNNGVEELDQQKEYKLVITNNNLVGKVITQAVDQSNQSATIVIYKTDDTRAENDPVDPREIVRQIEVNPDGSYELDLEIGTYDLVVKKASYLEYRVTGIEILEQVQLADIQILAGDIMTSGEIEVYDLVALNENIGITITDENKVDKSIYDLNEDGGVDIIDREILKANYTKLAQTVAWINPSTAVATMSLEEEESSAGGEPDDTEDENIELIQNTAISVGVNLVSIEVEQIVENDIEEIIEEKPKMIVPMATEYTITSEYGYRTHPTTGEYKKHTGIDLSGVWHTEILAVADGEVTFAGVNAAFGNCVEIKHNIDGKTIYSFYAHLSEINVEVGQIVEQGQVIGL